MTPINFPDLDGGMFWLDELRDITIPGCTPSSTRQTVYLALNGRNILSMGLYPIGTTLHLNLEELLREKAVMNLHSMMTVTLSVTPSQQGNTAIFAVGYRSRTFSQSFPDFMATRFLTTADTITLPPGATGILTAFAGSGETLEFKHTSIWLDTDGIRQSATTRFTETFPAGTFTAEHRYSWDSRATAPGCTPLLLRISSGEKTLTCYPGRTSNVCFEFRNIFNARERLYIPAKTTRKISSRGSLATINSELYPFDLSQEEEMTAELAPTLPEDILRLSQISASPQTRFGENARALREIVMLDADWESDPDPETLSRPTFKFKWKDPIPGCNLPEIGGERIHSDHFTEEFS